MVPASDVALLLVACRAKEAAVDHIEQMAGTLWLALELFRTLGARVDLPLLRAL